MSGAKWRGVARKKRAPLNPLKRNEFSQTWSEAFEAFEAFPAHVVVFIRFRDESPRLPT